MKTVRTQSTTHERADPGATHASVSLDSDSLVVREVTDWLRTVILEGRSWTHALLEAVGRCPIAEEQIHGARCQYLLLGEAFDWLVLAGRLRDEMGGLIPTQEKYALLFRNHLPGDIPESEFRDLIGPDKYRAHLNYFYGVVVEESLLLAVEELVRKERRSLSLPDDESIEDTAHQRLYGDNQQSLLMAYCKDIGSEYSPSISLTGFKEFTYWLFKYRLRRADKARIASDTRKGLRQLRNMRQARSTYRQRSQKTTM